MYKYIRCFAASIVIIIISLLTIQLLNDSTKHNEYLLDYSEVNSIKYGILNAHAWKDQIAEIISHKIQDFELTQENRLELKESIQVGMYDLLDQVEDIIEDKRNKGNIFQRAFTTLFQKLVFDVNDLRQQIPEFTSIIMEELDNYETREKLKKFIQSRIEDLFYETIGEEEYKNIEVIKSTYDCFDLKSCSMVLGSQIQDLETELRLLVLLILSLTILVFLIILLGNKKVSILGFSLLIITSFLLLYPGVSISMINIDARISEFSFKIWGEKMEFTDQILFFQSKSIIEVIEILLNNDAYEVVIVGLLIMGFSIILPMTKLLCSWLIISNKRMAEFSPIRFLALKTSKWSMADVFVVSIFMAYIGFNGILKNQLQQLENISDQVDILTTNYSSIGLGFGLFLSFCMVSLLLSTIISRRLE